MSPLAQLFFILWGLFALASPILVIALYVRHNKLQARVKAAEEESAKQASALRQELAELKRQVAAQKTVGEKAATDKAQIEKALRDKAAIEKAAADQAQILKAAAEKAAMEKAAAEIAAAEKAAEERAAAEKALAERAAVAEPASLSEGTPEKPRQDLPPVSLPPAVVIPASRSEIPPSPPVAQQSSEPASGQKQEEREPAPERTAPKPEDRAPAAPPMAARVSVPAPASPLRISAARPTMRERMNQVSAFEEALGTNWLQKLGIVLLVLGVASFGIYELAALGSFGKVLVSHFSAAALLGGGIFLERRERYQLLGRTGIGGGWALLFFTTFAMYHVEAMRVLHSLVLDSTMQRLQFFSYGSEKQHQQRKRQRSAGSQ